VGKEKQLRGKAEGGRKERILASYGKTLGERLEKEKSLQEKKSGKESSQKKRKG